MGITNYGKSGLALLLSVSGSRPAYLAIGSGSGVVSANNSELIYETSRQVFSTIDVGTQKEITYTADWGASAISGTVLREFGVFSPSSGGTPWNREGFTGVTFDGTNELQIQITYQIV